MPEDATVGMGLLEDALKLDPDYAAAHAYLAWGLEMRVVRGGYHEADAIAGVRHARAALAHGTDDPTALAVASLVLLHLDNDFSAASGAIARALAVNGSCAMALIFGAHVHGLSGDPALAEDYANRALRLSPFDPLAWEAYLALGMVRMSARCFDEAALFFSKRMQANPRFSTHYAFQAGALALAGRVEEAKSVAHRLLELEPSFRIRPLVEFFSPFTRPGLTQTFADGLRLTGIPE
jgi:adenylate cyclase